MQREADTFISNNDKAFIVKALQEETRLDGRRPYDFRKIRFEFGLDGGSATVFLGQTRVMTCVTAELEAPFPDRPSEGVVRFDVEMGPMASPAFEAGRPGDAAIEIARLIERGLRQSGAIDQEALCVMTGRKVWSLRLTTHVLDHCGNLIDAACLSALAALLAFRKLEVTVGGPSGTDLIVHSPDVKEPLPLTLHHLPLSVTFALFEDGRLVAVDPTLKEEAAMSGSCTIMANPHKEVCAVHKADGIGLSPAQFMRCVRLALVKVEEITAELKRALEAHEVARVQARIRRHRCAPALPQEGRHVAMLIGQGDNQNAAAAAATDGATDGMDMSDEETSSSASSSEEEGREKDPTAAATVTSTQETGHSAMVDAIVCTTSSPRLGVDKAAPGRPAGAKLVGSIRQQHTGDSAKAAAAAKGAAKRTFPAAKFDELEAIAAVIAGAKAAAALTVDAPAPDLNAAVKHHKVKGKKQKATQVV